VPWHLCSTHRRHLCRRHLCGALGQKTYWDSVPSCHWWRGHPSYSPPLNTLYQHTYKHTRRYMVQGVFKPLSVVAWRATTTPCGSVLSTHNDKSVLRFLISGSFTRMLTHSQAQPTHKVFNIRNEVSKYLLPSCFLTKISINSIRITLKNKVNLSQKWSTKQGHGECPDAAYPSPCYICQFSHHFSFLTYFKHGVYLSLVLYFISHNHVFKGVV